MDKVRRVVRDMWSASGRQALGARLATRLAERVPPSLLQSHLAPDDVASCRALRGPDGLVPPDRPMRVGWLMAPPGPGSGGHTTAFRMVKALEDAGHECTLLLYDPFHGSTAAQERTIRTHWPEVGASVRSVDQGFTGLDACIATGWQTAHVLARRTADVPLARLYFIQDYEPYFYPTGFESALAEQTYGFGFRNIALGEMVAEHLRSRGRPCTPVPFGCDTETYSLGRDGHREGIALYARSGTSRRGFLLAKMALEEFHRRAPEVPIHVYGPTVSPPMGVPVIDHGRLSPPELNQLYNRCIAGLALSFTNVSLVLGEMLAAGCVPVANESADARAVEPSPFVRWSEATPVAVADALVDVVRHPPPDVAEIAASVSGNWHETGKCLVAVVERAVYGAGAADWTDDSPVSGPG